MNRRKFLQSAGIALGALALSTVGYAGLSAPLEVLDIDIGNWFRAGDVILIDAELITIIGFDANHLPIVRRG